MSRITTQPRESKTLMTWSRGSHRDHVLAAIGVIVGMLTVALFVVAVVVLDRTAAHAAALDDPLGLRELAGAVVMLATIITFAAVWSAIANRVRGKK